MPLRYYINLNLPTNYVVFKCRFPQLILILFLIDILIS